MEYDGSLESLFMILEEVCNGMPIPSGISRPGEGQLLINETSQADLFDDPKPVIRNLKNPVTDTLTGIAGELYEASASGYSNFVQAWMSELPIETEIIRFGFKLIQAARSPDKASIEAVSCEGREAAEISRNDRMDPAVKIVRDASHKTGYEAHRLTGLLRFSPGTAGVPVACCSPDHFILPILAEHFTLRFGDSPWAIIDEKRGIVLIKNIHSEAELDLYNPDHPWFKGIHNANDTWEKLWLFYFKAINNESRANPKVQLRFMPKRYWKYLPEVRDT